MKKCSIISQATRQEVVSLPQNFIMAMFDTGISCFGIQKNNVFEFFLEVNNKCKDYTYCICRFKQMHLPEFGFLHLQVAIGKITQS